MAYFLYLLNPMSKKAKKLAAFLAFFVLKLSHQSLNAKLIKMLWPMPVGWY